MAMTGSRRRFIRNGLSNQVKKNVMTMKRRDAGVLPAGKKYLCVPARKGEKSA
jgi:hypothetical protein